MGKAGALTVAGKEIVVKELTVKQVEEVVDACADGDVTTLDLLFNDIPSAAVVKSSGLSYEELQKMRPSEVRVIADEVKKVNPFFVSMFERLSAAAKEMLNPKRSKGRSGEQSAD